MLVCSVVGKRSLPIEAPTISRIVGCFDRCPPVPEYGSQRSASGAARGVSLSPRSGCPELPAPCRLLGLAVTGEPMRQHRPLCSCGFSQSCAALGFGGGISPTLQSSRFSLAVALMGMCVVPVRIRPFSPRCRCSPMCAA